MRKITNSNIVYCYSKLLGKIKEIYGTQEQFAKQLGIGRVSLNQRLHNKLEFTFHEINESAKLLGISAEEIPIYFFTVVKKTD